jgi:predicted MFS family arabinose efflux permease
MKGNTMNKTVQESKVTPIILSLNASFMHLGFSFGALLGALTLTQGSLSNLGWVGTLRELALFLVTSQRVRQQFQGASLSS